MSKLKQIINQYIDILIIKLMAFFVCFLFDIIKYSIMDFHS